MNTRCKITILKTTLQEDLAAEYGVPGLGTCPLMHEGQVFYSDYGKPEGFCDEAWKAIYQYVLHSCMDRTAGTSTIGWLPNTTA